VLKLIKLKLKIYIIVFLGTDGGGGVMSSEFVSPPASSATYYNKKAER
jgi:hypothetical protein